jgi:hypothetical protein
MALSSVEENDSGGEVNSGEEISGEFVIARGDRTKVLEFIEEALDQITLATEGKVARRWLLAAGV